MRSNCFDAEAAEARRSLRRRTICSLVLHSGFSPRPPRFCALCA